MNTYQPARAAMSTCLPGTDTGGSLGPGLARPPALVCGVARARSRR